MSEVVSSLVDGEASITQADIENLKNRPEMAKKWQNYHLIKHVMQNTAPHAIRKDFSASVMYTIAQEPVVLVPKRSKVKQDWFRPAVGLAIAATVALATIGGLQTIWQPKTSDNQTPVLLSQLTPEVQNTNIQRYVASQVNTAKVVGALPVNVNTARPVDAPINNVYNPSANDLRWKRTVPSQTDNKKMAEELNKLLMNHVRSSGTMQGMLPYARLAGYDAE